MLAEPYPDSPLGDPGVRPDEFIYSIHYLLNDHKSDPRRHDHSQEALIGYPVDPGPDNPYDPGPAVCGCPPPHRKGPHKPVPPDLLSRLSPHDLRRYNSMNYSQQEGFIAQLLVREKDFCVEDSRAWRAIVEVLDGKAPTSVQVRRFLQYLERAFNAKVPREDKRFRANGVMWIDNHWDIVAPHIPVIGQISRDPLPRARPPVPSQSLQSQ
jgi:hypothetical protein